MNTLDPQAGQWYRHLDKGEMFQVVDADAEEGWVETQSFDGNIEQLSDEEWRTLEIETCEPPEDWTGPYDDIERDDLGYTDTDMSAEDWRAPIEGIPAPPEPREDIAAEDEQDEWGEGRPGEPFAEEQEAARHQLD